MGETYRRLSQGVTRLSWFCMLLSEIALAGLLLLVFHEVIVRYVFNSPTLYSVEISEYLLVFVAFMSIAWVLNQDRHVQVSFAVDRLPPKARRYVDIVTSLLVTAFCGIIVWKGGKTAVTAYTGGYHSSSLLNFPLWVPYAFIPLGALVMGLQYIIRIVDRLMDPAGARGPRRSTEK